MLDWTRLDNAAKIFPSAPRRGDTQVFRFSCELTTPVIPALLQRAAEDTLARFPTYRYGLRRGFFWYYLEETRLRPVVREEKGTICAPLYQKRRPGLLFSVSYYGCRINLELFHVLADGTGGLRFLQALVLRYLALKEKKEFAPGDYDASFAQLEEDSFSQYYGLKSRKKTELQPRAVKLRGKRLPHSQLQLILGRCSASAVSALAKENGGTVGAFLCAALIEAVLAEVPVRDRKRPVSICVPVNLRRYFPSGSARNFFYNIHVHGDFSGMPFFQRVLLCQQQMKERITPEKLTAGMNGFGKVERNPLIRLVPLGIKDRVLHLAFDAESKKDTAGLSNIGRITMPPQARPFVRGFDFCAATDSLQVCVASFEDTMSISFLSPFRETEIPRRFFRRLCENGVEVCIESNTIWEGGKTP